MRAGRARDLGSAAVSVSLALVLLVWSAVACGMQRMPGRKAVAIEGRRAAYDFTVGDEGPFAHQPLLEELVESDTRKCRRQRLYDEQHGARLLLCRDQKAEHHPGRVIPRPRDNAEEAPDHFPAAQFVDPQTQVQIEMIQIVDQYSSLCGKLLRESAPKMLRIRYRLMTYT